MQNLKRVQTCTLAVLILAASGCGSMLESDEPALHVYWLEPLSGLDPSDLSLRVSLVPGLDSDHIWVLQDDRRLNYYAGAVWPDRLGEVLPSVLVRSLGIPAGTQATLLLTVEIERFFAVETASGTEVVLSARIHAQDHALPLCAFNTTIAPATERLRDIVAAHEDALHELARTLHRIGQEIGKEIGNEFASDAEGGDLTGC